MAEAKYGEEREEQGLVERLSLLHVVHTGSIRKDTLSGLPWWPRG